MTLRVAVVVPTRRLGEHLRETLAHVATQTVAPSAVHVVGGPGAPNRKRLLAALADDADLVALLDDDAYPRADWLERAIAAFEDPDVVAAGGPSLTPPGDPPLAARDVAELPSCNLIVRRTAFLAAVQAALDLWPCEDSALCEALRAAGGRIRYDPHIVVYRHRRPLFREHLAQMWRYAAARGALARRRGASRAPAYAVPSAFAAGHASAIAALLARVPYAGGVLAALAAVYAAGVAAAAARAPRGTPRVAMAAGIYLTHLAYGCGYAAGAVMSARPPVARATGAAAACPDA